MTSRGYNSLFVCTSCILCPFLLRFVSRNVEVAELVVRRATQLPKNTFVTAGSQCVKNGKP